MNPEPPGPESFWDTSSTRRGFARLVLGLWSYHRPSHLQLEKVLNSTSSFESSWTCHFELSLPAVQGKLLSCQVLRLSAWFDSSGALPTLNYHLLFLLTHYRMKSRSASEHQSRSASPWNILVSKDRALFSRVCPAAILYGSLLCRLICSNGIALLSHYEL